MTLYLKYRPQTVSELDLSSVREKLTNLLSKESIPHAFLFTGPRGTGKTSSARIVAKAINCENKKKGSFEPCNECDTCRTISAGTNIDVIEMDAASNRGIDEIRALKQEVMLSPSISKKKIYIIDEVHMLTTEAANALLKTLEEPPSHVVFILATTDPQKLPQTVISRLSVIQFERASIKEITQKLETIVKNEKFEVEDGVLAKLAKKADGSFRDAVKLLEELTVLNKKITNEEVDNRFFAGASNIKELLSCLSTKDLSGALSILSKITQSGADEKSFLTLLIDEVHSNLLESVEKTTVINTNDSIRLLEFLLDARSKISLSNGNFLLLEIAIFKYCGNLEGERKKEQILPKEGSSPAVVVSEKTEEKKTDKVLEISGSNLDDTTWAKILFDLRNKNAGVEALLRAAKPLSFDGNTFKVGVFFKFHKERLETQSCLLVFEDVLKENFGNVIKIVYELTDAPVKVQMANSTPSLTTPQQPDIINAAKEIFGS